MYYQNTKLYIISLNKQGSYPNSWNGIWTWT